MKLKYSIGYFVIVTAAVLAFIYAYAMNNRLQLEGYTSLEEPEIEIVNSNSDDVVSEGYYLYESNGYVMVYLFDQTSIFEETDILISSLPEGLQEEIVNGKYIQTSEELYSFLENYSS